MLDKLKQTRGEKIGTVDGINLFFGALLGANLGTIEQLGMNDYVKLIILLSGTVMALRMVSTSERRLYSLLTVAFYAALLAWVFLTPNRVLAGLEQADKDRLGVTLGIWTALVLGMEFWPTNDAGADRR